MAKKILIPLDGSKLAETALHYVDELISALMAEQKIEVTLVQVVRRSPQKLNGNEFSGRPLPATDEEMEPLKNKALAYLNQVAEGLQGKGVHVECKAIIGEMATSSAKTRSFRTASTPIGFQLHSSRLGNTET